MRETTTFERRHNRSDDLLTALHYQLAFAKKEGQFDALVLADSAGCLVAGAGAWPTCERLAAYAPLIVHEPEEDTSLPELAELRQSVELFSIATSGGEVLLCGQHGGPGATATMQRAASGCQRILNLQA